MVVGVVIGSDETVVVLCVVVVAGAGWTTRSERNEQPAANMLAVTANKRMNGQPQRWESLGNLGAVKADAAAIAYAVERDWLIISGGCTR